MNTFASEIKNAIETVKRALEEFTAAEVDRIRAKDRWDREYLMGIAQEKFSGKNAEARMGEALQVIGDLWESLQACIEWSEQKKLALDLARLELEKWKMLLRVDEIEARIIAEASE